jgi:hypothetical protein
MANAPSGTSPPPVTSALALPSPGLSPIRNLASAGLGDRSRRLPFALAGIAICAAGIAGALWLFSAGDDADPPPLAVAPEGSAVAAPRAATATASPSIAEVTPPPAPASAPTPPAVSAAPPAPSATPPAAPEPDGELAANPKLVASRPVKRARSDGHSPERPSSGRPEATPLAAAIDASALVETHAAKPVVPAPAAEPVPPAAPHDSRSAANPADLVEPRLPATGVTPAAISELYSSIARALGRLAVDQSQDLRDRFRTFDIQALMLAAPAVRDAAVPSLLQLLRDARARKTSSPQPRSASHPSRRRVSGQDSPAEP